MYCKKCGKKLDDNRRFCKRCGSSVSGGESAIKAKKREIEKLSNNRKKRDAQRKADEKKKSKTRISEKTLLLIIILVALIILAVPAIISYNMFTNNSEDAIWRTQDGSMKVNETSTPMPKETPKTDNSTPYTVTENTNEDGYREFEFDGKIFLYPSTFAKGNSGGESRLRLADSSGDGIIELKTEVANDKPQKLMMNFAQSDPQYDVKSSRAGDDWYNIDIHTATDVIHRKCVVVSGQEVSYTFTYPKNSKYEALYQQYIEYMDEKFSY